MRPSEGVSATTNLLVLAFTTPPHPGTFSNGTFSLLFPTQPAVYYDVYYATNLSREHLDFSEVGLRRRQPRLHRGSRAASPTRFYRVGCGKHLGERGTPPPDAGICRSARACLALLNPPAAL
jgi:hypothetical protein